MLPKLVNLPDAYRGDSYGPIVFEYFDDQNIPINVEIADVKCQVGTRKNYRQIVLQWPEDTHNISLSGNMISLNTVPFEKMKFPAGIYFYDLEVKINNTTKTIYRGNLTLIDEVTNY